MFQFPGFAFVNLCIQSTNTWFTSLLAATEVAIITKYQVGCPIQKSMDQSLFSAPHGLSQSITSFIASYCQGIHQTPFSRLIWSRKSKAFPVSSPSCKKSRRTKSKCIHCNVSRWFATDTVRIALLLFRLVYLTWNKIDLRDGHKGHAAPHVSQCTLTRVHHLFWCCFSLYDVKYRSRGINRPIGRLNANST